MIQRCCDKTNYLLVEVLPPKKFMEADLVMCLDKNDSFLDMLSLPLERVGDLSRLRVTTSSASLLYLKDVDNDFVDMVLNVFVTFFSQNCSFTLIYYNIGYYCCPNCPRNYSHLLINQMQCVCTICNWCSPFHLNKYISLNLQLNWNKLTRCTRTRVRQTIRITDYHFIN